MSKLADFIRSRITDYTPGVGRVFLRCKDCRRLIPHYRVSGKTAASNLACRCGCPYMRPAHINDVLALAWVIYAFVWRRLIRRLDDWEPRMPFRVNDNPYA